MWDRTRYPDNWDEIALQIKEQDGWCCRWCGMADGTRLPGRKRPIWLVTGGQVTSATKWTAARRTWQRSARIATDSSTLMNVCQGSDRRSNARDKAHVAA